MKERIQHLSRMGAAARMHHEGLDGLASQFLLILRRAADVDTFVSYIAISTGPKSEILI